MLEQRDLAGSDGAAIAEIDAKANPKVWSIGAHGRSNVNASR
jgi:hypothetical protein